MILMEPCRSGRCGLSDSVSWVVKLPCEGMHSAGPLVAQDLLWVEEWAKLVIPPHLGGDRFLAIVE